MKDLRQVRADWTTLGAADPLWAVLVTPEGRDGGWDPADFLATGRAEVDAVLEHVDSLGLRPGSGHALDFGCGAGRLSVALSASFDQVVGVDLSEPMLAMARRLDVDGRCTFVRNDDPDLRQFADESFDLVYSSLVLQHVPPPHNAALLAELLRVTKPGGVVVVQLADRPDASARGILTRVLPRPALRALQQHVLRYPAPMDMYPLRQADVEAVAARAGARIADVRPEPMYGGHWHYVRYYLVRG